jgi:hypothetical protein
LLGSIDNMQISRGMEDLASFQVQLSTDGGVGYGHYGHVSTVSSYIWNTKHGIRTARDSLQLLAKLPE